MAENEIKMVDVTRHDVTVTLDDILTPLTATAAKLKAADVGAANAPEVADQLDKFTGLVEQLKAVTGRLNQLDSQLLESKRDQGPIA